MPHPIYFYQEPCLFSNAITASSTLPPILPITTASSNSFGPPYKESTQQSFAHPAIYTILDKITRVLPIEVRFMIYSHLFPSSPQPRRSPNGYSISLARRSSLHGKNPSDSERSPVVARFREGPRPRIINREDISRKSSKSLSETNEKSQC